MASARVIPWALQYSRSRFSVASSIRTFISLDFGFSAFGRPVRGDNCITSLYEFHIYIIQHEFQKVNSFCKNNVCFLCVCLMHFVHPFIREARSASQPRPQTLLSFVFGFGFELRSNSLLYTSTSTSASASTPTLPYRGLWYPIGGYRGAIRLALALLCVPHAFGSKPVWRTLLPHFCTFALFAGFG